jgi:hypothetical protein
MARSQKTFRTRPALETLEGRMLPSVAAPPFDDGLLGDPLKDLFPPPTNPHADRA